MHNVEFVRSVASVGPRYIFNARDLLRRTVLISRYRKKFNVILCFFETAEFRNHHRPRVFFSNFTSHAIFIRCRVITKARNRSNDSIWVTTGENGFVARCYYELTARNWTNNDQLKYYGRRL